MTLFSLALDVAHVGLTVAVAPLLTGWVRWVKARLTLRRGPSPFQPYRDLRRLLRKDIVLADSVSWVFIATPFVLFAIMALAACLVPTFTPSLALAPTSDLITLVALLGLARFMLALAGMDAGTSFGGLGSSREMLIATLAEPAMLMVVFSVALMAHTTALPNVALFVLAHPPVFHISLVLALSALVLVALAENARIPIDNPTTHLELTMVHEAMILEYTGPHLALIEAAAMIKLTLYVALIACLFAPWGMATDLSDARVVALGIGTYLGKLAVAGTALAVFETGIAKMRVFRYPEFLGTALLMGLLAIVFLYVNQVVS